MSGVCCECGCDLAAICVVVVEDILACLTSYKLFLAAELELVCCIPTDSKNDDLS